MTNSQREYAKRKNQKRHAEAAKDRLQRPRHSDADRAIAAGLVEGEGTITIASGGRAACTRAFVSLTSVDPETIQWLNSRWPGCITRRQPKGNARIAYKWDLNQGEKIWRFLDDIEPFLIRSITKKKSALVKQDVESRVQGTRDSNYRDLCIARMMVVRVLNRRGRMVGETILPELEEHCARMKSGQLLLE